MSDQLEASTKSNIGGRFRTMNRKAIVIAASATLAAWGGTARATAVAVPFTDNYDSYTTGAYAGTVGPGSWVQTIGPGGSNTAWSVATRGAVSSPNGYNNIESVGALNGNDASQVLTNISGLNTFTESSNFVVNATPANPTSSTTRDGLIAASTTAILSSGDYYLGDYNLAPSTNNPGVIRIVGGAGSTFAQNQSTTAVPLVVGDKYLQTLTGTYNSTNNTEALSYTVLDLNNTSATFTVTATDTTPQNSGNYFGYRAATSPNGSQNTTFDNFSLTPEPSSLALAGLGTLGLLARRKRQA